MTVLFMTTLPFPPSVNGAYGGGSGQQRFKSKTYKAWLKKCPRLMAKNINQPITIEYILAWPDKRLRDGQNYLKVALDYLVSENVLADDNYTIVTSESWEHVGIDKGSPRIEIVIKTAD